MQCESRPDARGAERRLDRAGGAAVHEPRAVPRAARAWSDCATACRITSTSSRKTKRRSCAAPRRGSKSAPPSPLTTPRATSRARQPPPESPLTRETVKRVRASLAARRRRDARGGDLSGCHRLRADRRRRASRAENDDMDAVDGATGGALRRRRRPAGGGVPGLGRARGASSRGRPRRGVRRDRRRRGGDAPKAARGVLQPRPSLGRDSTGQPRVLLTTRLRRTLARLVSFSSRGWTRDGHSSDVAPWMCVSRE